MCVCQTSATETIDRTIETGLRFSQTKLQSRSEATLRAFVALTILAILALASAARAAQPVMGVRLVDYRVSVTCPERDAFLAQVLERTSRVRMAHPDERSFEFAVEVSDSGRASYGRLTLRETDGKMTVRAVSGETCDEVVSALALIAAVLVDPNAASGTSAADSAGETGPSLVARDTAAQQVERDRASAKSSLAQPAPATTSWEFGGGFGLGLQGAIAPDPAVALSAELAAEVRNALPVDPLFSLALHYAVSEAVERPAGDGEATFKWVAARASVCPLRWPRHSFALRPCTFLDLGQLTGTGQRIVNRARAPAFWWATGFFGRIDAAPLDNLRLFLDLGLVVPLKRDRFYFEPDEPGNTALEVPSWGPLARAGIMAWLP